MQTRSLLFASLSMLTLASLAPAQNGNQPDNRMTTYYGQSVQFGSGTARTYVTVLKDTDARGNHKVPVEMGFEYPAAAVAGLDPHEEQTFIVNLPNAARDTPFQYMMVGWNPHGHPPFNFYGLPHFDFHFYIQDLDEVMAIDPGPCNGLDCEDFARAMKPVPAPMTPQGYINVGSVVPHMGNHLIDPLSPEFNGQTFTKTFLYGAYDGKITFLEPMITKAWLDGKPTAATGCADLKLPQEYAETGYYPTRYCAVYNSETGNYRISINNFVWRVAPMWATTTK